MKDHGRFITIHGIDGTGKTTVTRLTAQLLKSHGVNVLNYDEYEEAFVNNPFSVAKKRVLVETPDSAQFAFYLGSTIFHSARISSLLELGQTVIKSRFIDDVLAYHAHLGVQSVAEIASLLPIIIPDFKVLLTLQNESERRRRIISRGIFDEKDLETRREGGRLDFFEKYLLRSISDFVTKGKATIIDTGTIRAEDVANQVVDSFLYGKRV